MISAAEILRRVLIFPAIYQQMMMGDKLIGNHDIVVRAPSDRKLAPDGKAAPRKPLARKDVQYRPRRRGLSFESGESSCLQDE